MESATSNAAPKRPIKLILRMPSGASSPALMAKRALSPTATKPLPKKSKATKLTPASSSKKVIKDTLLKTTLSPSDYAEADIPNAASKRALSSIAPNAEHKKSKKAKLAALSSDNEASDDVLLRTTLSKPDFVEADIQKACAKRALSLIQEECVLRKSGKVKRALQLAIHISGSTPAPTVIPAAGLGTAADSADQTKPVENKYVNVTTASMELQASKLKLPSGYSRAPRKKRISNEPKWIPSNDLIKTRSKFKQNPIEDTVEYEDEDSDCDGDKDEGTTFSDADLDGTSSVNLNVEDAVVEDAEKDYASERGQSVTPEASGITIGFTEDQINAIVEKKKVYMSHDQVRVLCLWMKENRARSTGLHPEAYKRLVKLFKVNDAKYSDSVRSILHHRLRAKVLYQGVAMETCGAISVFDKKERSEITVYADWTDTWLEKDWNGSIKKPENWDGSIAEVSRAIEDPELQPEIFDVGEIGVSWVMEKVNPAYNHVPIVTHVDKPSYLWNPFLESQPPTLHMGEAEEIAWNEKHRDDWEDYEDGDEEGLKNDY